MVKSNDKNKSDNTNRRPKTHSNPGYILYFVHAETAGKGNQDREYSS